MKETEKYDEKREEILLNRLLEYVLPIEENE